MDAAFGVEPTALPDSISESKEVQTADEVVEPEEVDEAIPVPSAYGGIDGKDSMIADLKDVTFKAVAVMSTMEKDIKIGSPPRVCEVYAKMVDSIAGLVGKRAEIEIADAKLKMAASKGKPEGIVNNTQNNFFIGTSSDMLKALKETRKLAKNSGNPYDSAEITQKIMEEGKGG